MAHRTGLLPAVAASLSINTTADSGFARSALGVDPDHGRFAEVSLDRCRQCGRLWLHYFFEYEAFRASGRWYRGLVSEEQARTITATTAAAVLEALPWYFAGGSYYDGVVQRWSGPLR